MTKKFTILLSVFALLLCLGAVAFGQETTGDIEITVKDPNGAVVPNVSITIASSNAAGFKRTVQTDDDGSVRVIKIPPGIYTVTAAATSGFAEKIVPGVQVVLGKVTPVSVDLGVANVDPTTVTVNSTDVSPVDTTDNKIQTNITAEIAELLPKGTNFDSILKVSPATRPEPRSGQFQIDGASGSENTFIIDGQEVTNIRTGVLDQNSNLPFQLIQEVQIKSSGFEAEYGGATGGVINVVTKGGSNRWRGEFGTQFRVSGLEPTGRPALIYNTFDPSGDRFAEYYPSRRDNYHEFNPTLNLGGPIVKDKLWFFGSYTPQIFERTRAIDYVDPYNRSLRTFQTQVYKFKQVDNYSFLRLDSQPFSKLRLTGAFTWNPISQEGEIPAWSSALFEPPSGVPCTAPICQNGNPSLFGAAYLNQTGGRQNSSSLTGQAVYSVMSNLILSFRGGRYFLNEKLGSYGLGDLSVPRVLCSGLSPMEFPPGFGCTRGVSNGFDVVESTVFDVTRRNTFDGDATFIANFGGRHEFKGGFQYNGISNKVFLVDTDQIIIRYGQPIGDYSETFIPSSPTAVGSGSLVRYNESGDVSSKNIGIFFQDKWQPVNRLTLNLGIRTEREDVPSFNPALPGVQFDFTDKIAPRLGFAFDLTGDGKTKISAFYGWFYDRFKYELPRGSFGGAIYHQMFFEVFPGNTLSMFTVSNILGTGGPIPGGRCPTTLTPIYGIVRCDLDYRISSNSGGPIDEVGAIDPNLKAFRQSEFTVTFERDLGRNFVFSSRFTHKNVDHTVEDAGFPNSHLSEFYIIGNPGEGLHAELADQYGVQALKPIRTYDALEVRLDRHFANDFYFNLNYTWSRLFGNYSGLASSDEDGRLSPNVNRFFDQPQAGWTVAGGPDNGLLSTDRPHVVKFYGAYSLDWNKRFGVLDGNSTEFQFFTTFQSGTPITSVISLDNIDTIVLTERGDAGRTEMFTQTDFAIRNRFKFGRDKRFTLVVEADVLNLFNEANELNRVNSITEGGFSVLSDPALVTPAELDACTLAGSRQPCVLKGYARFQENGSALFLSEATDPNFRYPLYNKPNAFQGPRQVRFGIRFLF